MEYSIKEVTCFYLLIQLITLSYANTDDCAVNCGDLVQCTFQDVHECKNYIHCYLSGNAWVRLVRPCGFGKLWSPKHALCVHASAYNCTIDPCVTGTKKFYKYKSNEKDSNENTCGKYWDCKNGKSVPNCCCEGYAFIEEIGCVRDRNCTGSCKTFPRTRKCAHIVSRFDEISSNVSNNNIGSTSTPLEKDPIPPGTEGSEFFDKTRDILQESTVSGILEQDPCVTGTKKFYKYKSKEKDSNENTCGKYWDCKNGKSVPNCCCEGYAFIEGMGCVRDKNCTGSCKTFPRTRKCAHIVSRFDETPSNLTYKTSSTTTELPKDTVPPETEGSELFDITRDVFQESTVSDILEQEEIEMLLEREVAQPNIQKALDANPCNDPAIAKEGHYKDDTLNSHGCQSFWMCRNGVSRFTCCPHGSRYANNSGCIADFKCYDCIPNKIPKFVCTTEGVPSHRRKYIQDVNGIKYHRECPCGLRYEKTIGYCGCVPDQDWRTDPECTACKPDVALNFNETSKVLNCKETPRGILSEKSYSKEDVWSSSGGQKAAVLHGIPIVCSPNDNFSAGRFGYQSYVEVPFFQNNAAVLKTLYLKMKFKTYDMGSTQQILVSNCRFGESYPSLEVTIDKSSSELKIWASTEANNASFQISFEEFQWNVFILSFEGEVLKASVYPDNPRPNMEYTRERRLPGEILVSVQPGLRFGSCVQPGEIIGGSYFYGYIKYVKIYSCKPEYNHISKSRQPT